MIHFMTEKSQSTGYEKKQKQGQNNKMIKDAQNSNI